MNTPTPTDAEVAAASQTLMRVRFDGSALRNRLARAAAMLAALETLPVEPSLVFEREGMKCQPLGAGGVIGREGDEQLCFPNHAGMSRRHFRIFKNKGLWWVEDLGSRNGTLIDGDDEPVTKRALRDGDLIHAGDVSFLFVATE